MRLTNDQIRQLARNAVLGNADLSYTPTQAALVTLLIEFGNRVTEAQEWNELKKTAKAAPHCREVCERPCPVCGQKSCDLRGSLLHKSYG